MSILAFLTALCDSGRVRVPPLEVAPSGKDLACPEDLDQIAPLLQEIDIEARRELAGEPPAMALPATHWAALMLYRASQFLVYREVDAARVSPLHCHVAIRILQGMLAAIRPPAPGDLHHLLTSLREWLTRSGEPLSPACRLLLESITGTDKTASLADSLLKLESSTGRMHRQAVLAEELRGRVLRATRWWTREPPRVCTV